MKVTVLRLGHRKSRDKRITTHCALVARAFGARKIILSGERDDGITEGIEDVCKKWGNEFTAEYEKDWKKILRKWNGYKLHLTMYGEKPDYAFLRRQKNVLVVIGAGKVPGEVYKIADANIAIGSQPHSEVAALAILLNDLLGEEERWKKRGKAQLQIIPSKKIKKVIVLKARKA